MLSLQEVKYRPQQWVFDQIACEFPKADQEANNALPRQLRRPKHELDHFNARASNWFFEYARYDQYKGTVRFEVPPPGVPADKLHQKISNLYSAYEMLYQDSVRTTLMACLQRLSGRDLSVEKWFLPHGWSLPSDHDKQASRDRLRCDFLLGAPVQYTDPAKAVGALTDDSFCQYEPLRLDPQVWDWIQEGPISIYRRFGLQW